MDYFLDRILYENNFKNDLEITEFFEISLSTWYRWKEKGLKKHQIELLKLRCGYFKDDKWKGIQYKEGLLWNINNYGIHPNLINQIEFLLHLNSDREDVIHEKNLLASNNGYEVLTRF
jgi:hypothetical protein